MTAASSPSGPWRQASVQLGCSLFLQERRQQQTDQDLPSGGEVRLLRPANFQLGGGADQPLPPRVSGPVQPQTGRQAALPRLQTPTGADTSPQIT